MDHKKIRDFIDNENYQELLPFISKITMDTGDIYQGVVVNSDKSMISFIDINKMKDDKVLYDFVELCLDWWWYSSRHIPINLFYPRETQCYMDAYMTHIPNKTSVNVTGHVVSLNQIVKDRKSYRKNVLLQSKK